jgi:tetratricopeptide (TPR) repeat protein
MVLEHYLGSAHEAIPHYRVAIRRDPNDWRAHWGLARALLETKQYDEALKELKLLV